MLLSSQSSQSGCIATSKKLKPRVMPKDLHDSIKQADALGPRTLPIEEEDGDCSEIIIEGILDFLKCPICLEYFDDPCRVRDCGHIFC